MTRRVKRAALSTGVLLVLLAAFALVRGQVVRRRAVPLADAWSEFFRSFAAGVAALPGGGAEARQAPCAEVARRSIDALDAELARFEAAAARLTGLLGHASEREQQAASELVAASPDLARLTAQPDMAELRAFAERCPREAKQVDASFMRFSDQLAALRELRSR